LSSSTATGWDIGYALRLEEALCMLSGLCQSVLRADAQRRVQEELNISCDDTCSHLSLKADARSRESAHGGAHAVPPHRDLSAWLKDASSVMEEMTLLQEIDCDSFLSIALARMRDAAAARAHSGCGAGPLLLTHSVTATGTAGPVPGATLSVAVSAGVRRNDNARFEFVSFADDLFAAVREASALSAAQVVYSLDPVLLRSNRLRAHFSEGASSSFFCRSLDQLLVVKTISETEVKELLRLMPAYVRHLATNPSSLLCRFYGCYSLKLPSSSRAFFLVMGNAFPITDPGPCAETYDLKGSTVGRRARVSKSVTSRGKKGEVLSKGMIFQDMEFRERFPSGLPACDASQLVHELRSGRAPFEAALQAIALGDAPDAALASASVSGESTEHAVHALFGGGPAVTDGSSLLRSLDEGGELHDLTMPQAVAHAHPMDTTSLRAPLNDAPHTQSAWGGGSRTLSVDGGIERSRAIVAQLQSDVALLASHGLMDYSLLVNIMPVSEDDMSSADALSDATSSGLLVEDIAELLAALQEQEADTVLADASIDRRDVGVLYSLSLNKAPSLRYADALSLVQAATALPLHIASVGRPIPLIASAVTIPSAVTATAAAGAVAVTALGIVTALAMSGMG
ncbi:MAG: hypothetical protein EOO41_02535, partial [Methanobacteriota archaeon]